MFRAGGTLILLAGAAAAGIYWYQRGPGLEREVERLVAAAGLRPGTTAAEIGAGRGRMAALMAQHLGAGGRLYATELEAPQLEAIRQRVAGLGNVIVLPAGQDSTNLEAGCCDVIFMRRVYHHLTAPAAINRSIRAALRPGGRLVVIDFLTPRWAFWTRHGIAADEVVQQIAAAGLEPAGRFESWSLIDYGLVFRKAGGDALFGPGPAGSFDETAVKDPSIVQFEGKWHLFYTARGRGEYSLGHVAATSLDDLAKQPRRQLVRGYAAAPQVFYFRPHKKWYLIYQTKDANYQPVYSTNPDIQKTEGWSRAAKLVAKTDTAKWIDFWVICDGRFAYLFFTRAHRDVVLMKTRLTDFPNGWGEMATVFAPVHESVHVYREGGRYVMLFERAVNDIRHYGLAQAATLAGPWSEVEDRLAIGAPWTDEVSHGELIRSRYDETLAVGGEPWRFLIQGLKSGEHKGDYVALPWKLGVIEGVRSASSH